jgi:hypothetical protein
MTEISNTLNLHTEWAAEGYITRPHHESACYSSNFPRFKGLQKYKIWMYRDDEGISRMNSRNNVFLSLGELVEHIEYLKNLLPEGVIGDYEIEETETNGYNDDSDGVKAKAYLLSISIDGPNIYHKFALTWIRFAYELPYSLIILDANRLSEEEEFKHLGKLNLFNLCSSGYGQGEMYWRSDMSMGHFSKMMTDKELLEKMKLESEKPEQYLSHLFTNSRNSEIPIPGTKEISLGDHLIKEDWTEGKGYKERLEIYKYNFKLYKNEETTA